MTFDTSVLDRALAERRTEWERRRTVMLDQVIAVLDAVAPEYGVMRAYIFGSVTKPGRYHDHSDVDIAVERPGGDRFFDFAGEVSRRLGQDIDIQPIDQIPFADKIRREGVLWLWATSN
jgi:predicted nucleotidyltransferase